MPNNDLDPRGSASPQDTDLVRRKLLHAASLAAPVALLGSTVNAAAPNPTATDVGQARSALVTGSSRGIGAATARRLAQDGYA